MLGSSRLCMIGSCDPLYPNWIVRTFYCFVLKGRCCCWELSLPAPSQSINLPWLPPSSPDDPVLAPVSSHLQAGCLWSAHCSQYSHFVKFLHFRLDEDSDHCGCNAAGKAMSRACFKSLRQWHSSGWMLNNYSFYLLTRLPIPPWAAVPR